MTEKIGFIGAGKIGAPMCKRLLSMGCDLTIFDARKEARDAIVKLGARAAGSARQLAEQCKLIILQVKTDADVEEVITGQNGVISGMTPGTLIVIGSTVSPGLCRRMAKVVATKGGSLIDAGVSGGPISAADGTLAIMVGGDKKDFERALPVLKILGTNVFHLGPVGSGETAKIVNNVAYNINYSATLEALLLAKAAGMDVKVALEIMGKSSGNSYTVGRWDHLNESRLKKGPDGELHALPENTKDLGLALDFAESLGVDLPVAKFRIKTDVNSMLLELLQPEK